MKEICKGCATGTRYNELYNSQCSFQMMDLETTCPCIDCLIKVMCKEICKARKDALRRDIPKEVLLFIDKGNL